MIHSRDIPFWSETLDLFIFFFFSVRCGSEGCEAFVPGVEMRAQRWGCMYSVHCGSGR